MLLQDEALAVRAATLQLLGHLARWNPALILPDLRHLLMDILMHQHRPYVQLLHLHMPINHWHVNCSLLPLCVAGLI